MDNFHIWTSLSFGHCCHKDILIILVSDILVMWRLLPFRHSCPLDKLVILTSLSFRFAHSWHLNILVILTLLSFVRSLNYFGQLSILSSLSFGHSFNKKIHSCHFGFGHFCHMDILVIWTILIFSLIWTYFCHLDILLSFRYLLVIFLLFGQLRIFCPFDIFWHTQLVIWLIFSVVSICHFDNNNIRHLCQWHVNLVFLVI